MDDTAQRALDLADDLLRTAGLFLQNAVSAVADAVLLVDMADPSAPTVIYASESAHRLLGFLPGEMEGIALDRIIPVRFRGVHEGHVAGFAQDPRTRLMVALGSVPILRADGTESEVEIGLSPITLLGPLKVVVVLHDAS